MITLDWVGPLLLCTKEVSRIPAGISGVYMLHVMAPTFLGYPVFYVGQSRDIRRRLIEHMDHRSTKPSVQAIRELERAYWSAAPVGNSGLLAGVESSLIRGLAPPCNDQIPTAVPVLVNLPPMSFLNRRRI